MEPNSTKLVPLGRIDRSSRPELVEPQNYLRATNLRVEIADGKQGAQYLVHGNTKAEETEFPFGVTSPGGTDTCVGAFSDEDSGEVYFWLRNSLGNHGVYRLTPETSRVVALAVGPHVQLPGASTVASAVLIGNRFLIWTACETPGDTITGAPPQWLDLTRTGPDRTYEYLLQVGDPAVAGTYSYQLYGPDDALIVNTELITALPGGNPTTLYQLVALALSNRPDEVADQYIEGNALRVVMNPGYKLNITTPTGAFFYPLNSYPDELLETALDLVRRPPRYAPTVCHVIRPSIPYNYVLGKALQFRIRYRYRDGSISAWGPVSAVSQQVDAFGDIDEAKNAVEIDYSDALLETAAGRSLIASIDIAFREGSSASTSAWRLADNIRVEEMASGVATTYDFLYDRAYSVVASDGSGATPDTQVLKLFDRVPRIAAACSEITDEDGNSILALAGSLEGGDAPNAARVTWSISTEVTPTGDEDQGASCNITIRGRVLTSDKLGVRWDSDLHDLAGGPSGFVVFLAGTPYYGITDNFTEDATGFFEIKNVPRGQYVLRVASPLCRFDDTRGRKYNLTREGWQQTSAPVLGTALYNDQQELYIDLRTYVDPVYDISNAPVIVQDFNRKDETPQEYVMEGYLLDTEGNFATDAERLAGIGVAGQIVKGEVIEFTLTGGLTNQTIAGSQFEVRTDHNGYFFYLHAYTPNDPYDFSGFRITGMRGSDPCTGQFVDKDLDVVYSPIFLGTSDPNTFARYSDYRMLELGESLNQGDSSDNFVSGEAGVICVIEDAAFRSNHSEVVSGLIDNVGGDPVENAYVVIEGEGRTATTADDGLYEIRLFNPEGNLVVTHDFNRLIVGAVRDRCYDKPPDTNPVPFTFNFCAGAVTLNVEMDIIPGENVADTDKFRNLKAGGRYQTAIVYEDRANRKGEIVRQPDIYIPFHTEDGNGYDRRWVYYDLEGTPPVWATHYRFLRTLDGVYRSYQSRIVQDVRYVQITAPDATPVDTVYGSVDTTHILLQVDDYGDPADQTTNPVFFFAREEDGARVEANFRDFVRLVLDNNQVVVANDDILEAEIVGYHVDGSGNYYLVVDAAPFEDIEVLANFLVEIYTPRRSGDGLFYEMAEAFPILDAGTPERRHGALLQDQSSDNAVAARGYLRTGDTYWRRRLFEVVGGVTNYVLQTEDQSPTDREYADLADTGRVNPTEGGQEQYYWNRIRTSETYLTAGSLVGVNAFRALDVQAVNQDFGAIVGIPIISNRMVAVCRNRIQPIYVAFEAVVDLSGNALVGRTDRLLNLAPASVSVLGCQSPHSLVVYGGALYGVDLLMGEAWRYGQNGVQELSAGLDGTFLSAYGQDAAQLCVAGYDPLYDEWLVRIVADGGEDMVRAYRPERQGFTSEYTFAPEMLVRHRRTYVSFKDGTAYLHNQPGSTMFYEIPIFGEMKVVTAAGLVHGDKRFLNLRIVGSDSAEAGTIEVFGPNNTLRMRSRLLASRFTKRGHARMAPFLRDQLDPHFTDEQKALFEGRPLFGHYLELTLRDTSGLFVAAIDIESVPVMDTKQ